MTFAFVLPVVAVVSMRCMLRLGIFDAAISVRIGCGFGMLDARGCWPAVPLS